MWGPPAKNLLIPLQHLEKSPFSSLPPPPLNFHSLPTKSQFSPPPAPPPPPTAKFLIPLPPWREGEFTKFKLNSNYQKQFLLFSKDILNKKVNSQ